MLMLMYVHVLMLMYVHVLMLMYVHVFMLMYVLFFLVDLFRMVAQHSLPHAYLHSRHTTHMHTYIETHTQ